jgi:hypothetical protein
LLARLASNRNNSSFPIFFSATKRRTATMKALTWHGKGDIRCDSVPDPKIQARP